MDDEKIRSQIGTNIAAYRKRLGLTQAALADKLNYSDKAVSKWERGESVPDVITLMAVARELDVTVDDLLTDPNELPGEGGTVRHVVGSLVEKTLKRKANKNIILGLCSILVWFVAMLIYVVVSTCDIPYSWLAFFYAVPINAIVILSLRSAWRDFRWNRAMISVIMWGTILSLFVTCLVLWRFSIWRIFLLGIPGQIAILLWFKLFRNRKSEEDTDSGDR